MKEAQAIKAALEVRFAACGLTMHPTKTKIVYCRDGRRTGTHDHTKFTFLGYEFRQRYVKSSKTAQLFAGFTAAVSPAALTAMRQKARRLNYRNLNGSQPSGYCPETKSHPSWMDRVLWAVPAFGLASAIQAYRQVVGRLDDEKVQAVPCKQDAGGGLHKRVLEKCPTLFAHWKLGMAGAFA